MDKSSKPEQDQMPGNPNTGTICKDSPPLKWVKNKDRRGQNPNDKEAKKQQQEDEEFMPTEDDLPQDVLDKVKGLLDHLKKEGLLDT